MASLFEHYESAKPTYRALPTKKSSNNNTTKTTKTTKIKVTSTAQSPTSEDLQFLKHFDLNSDYGPNVGITRFDRYNRAKRNGLAPPQRIAELIMQFSENPEVTEPLWNKRL
eukprot:m.10500 g.10500  ORF g.10500 m.10500 type:complete len:112 (-) comp8344_c0_seq1:243-578(-)